MNHFEKTIKAFLDEQAAKDQQFAEKYKAEGKSIEECCRYIIGWVKESKRQGFADEEIYGQAMHYYDESDITVAKADGVKVVVNHAIELSESEKKEARKKARQEFEAAELKRLNESRTKKKAAAVVQPSMMGDLFGGL